VEAVIQIAMRFETAVYLCQITVRADGPVHGGKGSRRFLIAFMGGKLPQNEARPAP
jgi:hypothetical protein